MITSLCNKYNGDNIKDRYIDLFIQFSLILDIRKILRKIEMKNIMRNSIKKKNSKRKRCHLKMALCKLTCSHMSEAKSSNCAPISLISPLYL